MKGQVEWHKYLLYREMAREYRITENAREREYRLQQGLYMKMM